MITTDNELLGKYLSSNDLSALEELVVRHSGLVMGVCRGMLFSSEDAEDAFQATFLVLVRKATMLVDHGSISGWLYQVAMRNCQQIRRRNRRNREETMLSEPTVGKNEPWQKISKAEENALIYNEIDRLPKRYRDAVVMCYLQGFTRHDAAECLGWTDAAVKAALSRGRSLLRQKIARKGLFTGTLLVILKNSTASAAETVSPSLLTSTLGHCQVLPTQPSPGLTGAVPKFARVLAHQGAITMQTALFLKSMTVASVLVFAICLPLVAVAGQMTTEPEEGEIVVQQQAGQHSDGEKTTNQVQVEITQGTATVGGRDDEPKGSEKAEQQKVKSYRLTNVSAKTAETALRHLLASPDENVMQEVVAVGSNILGVSSSSKNGPMIERFVKLIDMDREGTPEAYAGGATVGALPTSVRVYSVKNRAAVDVRNLIRQLTDASSPEDQPAQIEVDTKNNLLIVYATEQNHEVVKGVVEALDSYSE